MNTNEKSKRGKAIIGIAMAAIMLASVFVAMVPMASAQAQDSENQLGLGKAYINCSVNGTYKVLIGETLNFTCTETVVGLSPEEIEGKTYGTTSDEYDTEAEFTIEGIYWVDNTDVYLSVDEPRLNIEIQDEAGKSIVSTTVGNNITLDLSTNLYGDDVLKIKERDPDDHVSTLLTANVSDVDGYEIDTTGWKTGEHDLWVETADDGDSARGLDITSTEDTITILKAEIDIKAEKTEPPKEEDVLFTVTAPPNTVFNFSVTHPEHVSMTTKQNNPCTGDEPVNYACPTSTTGTFTGVTDEDGLYKFVASFTEDRTYTLKVWFNESNRTVAPTDTYAGADTDEKEDLDIDVGKIAVTIDVSRTGVIGEDVPIKVTAAAGDDIDIVIDDYLEFDDETLVGGEAEVEWKTAGKTVGSYTIEVFVNCDAEDEDARWDVGEDVEDVIDDLDLDADETATIRLIEPGLSAEQPRDVVADGDDYVIKGTATGVAEVDIVIIGPDGLMEDTLGVERGLEVTSSSVSENEFEEEISIPDGSDAGDYIAIVLIPGRDGYYAGTIYEDGEFDNVLDVYSDGDLNDLGDDLKGKNKAQLMSIIADASYDAVGSDDQFAMLTFRVAAPYLEIVEPIAPVAVGEPLVIEITTNREDDVAITLTSPDCPDLPGETVRVKDGKANVTIDTTDIPVGICTIEVEDDDGNIDEATVEILTELPPPPVETPTPPPAATPTPPPAATPTPPVEETPTPEPPGFEAVFAIAGLLAVAYLVLRKRRK
jgi:PGF-CTERM protein